MIRNYANIIENISGIVSTQICNTFDPHTDIASHTEILEDPKSHWIILRIRKSAICHSNPHYPQGKHLRY